MFPLREVASPRIDRLILAFHTFATIGMTGFVQIVHYPLMAMVGRREYPAYEQRHTRLTMCTVPVPRGWRVFRIVMVAELPGDLAHRPQLAHLQRRGDSRLYEQVSRALTWSTYLLVARHVVRGFLGCR